jgi:nuclease S1
MRRLPALLALLVFSPAVMAWSALGHRLVGAIAEGHLQPSTQRVVSALLAGERDPTLAGVANWADALRDQDPERFRRTARWHYVNFRPGSCTYEPVSDCPDGQCVLGAIETQRALLADHRQPLAVRRDALKFLVHLVGDVHQPMHAGNRNDKGGNRFQVSLRTDLPSPAHARNRYVDGVMGTNLHAVWDYYVLATPRLDADAYVERLDAAPWPPKFSAGGPSVWAGESCRLGDALYPRTHALDRRYLDAQRPLAEIRIRQAAYRLAQLLDATLATPGE